MTTAEWEVKPPRECEHNWQPVSMVFETQLLDPQGRVVVRQPDLDEGRVYLVCTGCASHTYMTTSWIGYRRYGSEDANPRYIADPDGRPIPNPRHSSGYDRDGFRGEDDDA